MFDLSDSYEVSEFHINIKVRNPKYEDSFVTYEIAIETNDPSFSKSESTVRRRYSEFAALHKIVSKEFPALKCPRLPPRFPFKDHFRPAFVEKRREGLEEFLKKLISERMYLSSKALHLFLQSSHPMSEIKEIIHGKIIPAESHETDIVSNGLFNVNSACSLSSGTSSHSTSSPAELDVSANSSPAIFKNSNVLPSVPKNYDSVSPNVSKRVSFCDQVTVAQIHMG